MNPWHSMVLAFRATRMWVRYKLPWRTKGYLRDEVRALGDQRDHAVNAVTHFNSGLERAVRENSQLRLDLNAAQEEAKGELAARVTLEGQRIQEHEALRRLTFGLSNGLQTTLGLVNEMIVQMPDYTPDQAERAEVIEGLVKQVH